MDSWENLKDFHVKVETTTSTIEGIVSGYSFNEKKEVITLFIISDKGLTKIKVSDIQSIVVV